MNPSTHTRTPLQRIARIIGLIAITFGIAGGLFKVMHWPGGSFTLLLAHLFFTLHLLFFGLSCLTNKSALHKVWILSTTIFAIFISIGVFFKLMHWPGASALLVFGSLLFLFLGYIPLSITERKLNSSNLFTKHPFQHALIFSLMILLMLYGRKPARSILQSSRATTLNTIFDNSDMRDEVAVYQSINPQTDLDNQVTSILETIDRLTKTILVTCGEVQTDDLASDVQQLRHLDKYDEVMRIMTAGPMTDAMDSEQFNLLIQVAKLEDKWAQSTGNEPNRIDRPLTPSSFYDYHSTNELFQFQYVPQIMALNQLVEIEQMVLNMYLDMYIVKSLQSNEPTDDGLDTDELSTSIDEL